MRMLGVCGKWGRFCHAQRTILIGLCLTVTFQAEAQTVPSLQKAGRGRLLAGMGYSLFDENLTLRQASYSGDSLANYYGYSFFCEQLYIFPKWTWSLGAEVSLGRANTGGGGGDYFTYERSLQSWWGGALYGRYVHRLSVSTGAGLRVGAIYKNVSWPSLETGVQVQKANELGFFAMAELSLRFGLWEIQQGVGASGATTGTLWRLALARYF